MLIIRIPGLRLFNSTFSCRMHKTFQRVSSLSTLKNSLLNRDEQLMKKCDTDIKPVEFDSVNSGKTVDDNNLADNLVKWAVQNNISNITFSKLLKALAKCGIQNLPLNARALLKAKEDEIKVFNMPPGVYTHFGLSKGLKTLILNFTSKNLLNKTDIGIAIFIDNLLLSKFTQQSMWIILGSIENFSNHPFLVGVYCGNKRPNDSNLFLSEFVREAKHLCSKGLEINNMLYNIKIKMLICDAPAKSFVLNIKNFSGYSSCTKCNAIGISKNKRISFEYKNSPRKDEDFENEDLYKTEKCNLLEIPDFGVVSNVILDYMHLVCLGVVKKLILLWLTDKKHWICEDSASDMLRKLANSYPCEFRKKPLSFRLIGRWTAKDFRHFLLYHGPMVLKSTLKKIYYDHFLLLHVACRLLCIEASPKNVELGRKFFSDFVENYKVLYETEPISHNVHGLYHLADECTKHGTLDSFSAFPYENFLIQLRQRMEKSKKKLVPNIVLRESYEKIFMQKLNSITKRKRQVWEKLKISEGDNFQDYSHYKTLLLGNFRIIPSSKFDKYVLLKNGKMVEAVKVLKKKVNSQETCFIAGKEFSSVFNFYSKPYETLQLNMFKVEKTSDFIDLWPIDMINKKCIKIPWGSEESVMIGLLDKNF